MNKYIILLFLCVGLINNTFGTSNTNNNTDTITLTFGYESKKKLKISQKEFESLKNISQTIRDMCEDLETNSEITSLPLYSITKKNFETLQPYIKSITEIHENKTLKNIKNKLKSAEYQKAIDQLMNQLPNNFQTLIKLAPIANYLDIELLLHALCKKLALICNKELEQFKTDSKYFDKFKIIPLEITILIGKYILKNHPITTHIFPISESDIVSNTSTSERNLSIGKIEQLYRHKNIIVPNLNLKDLKNIFTSPTSSKRFIIYNKKSYPGAKSIAKLYDKKDNKLLSLKNIIYAWWSPDGSRLITKTKKLSWALHFIRNTITSKPLLTKINEIIWSKDSSKFIAQYDSGNVMLFDRNGKALLEQPIPNIKNAQWGPKNKTISFENFKYNHWLYDIKTKKIIKKKYDKIVWCPNESKCAFFFKKNKNSKRKIELYNIKNNTHIKTFSDIHADSNNICWNKNNNHILIKQEKKQYILFNCITKKLSKFQANAMSFSPNGKRIASLYNNKIILYATHSSNKLASMVNVSGCTWSPDSSKLITVNQKDKIAYLYDYNGKKIIDFTNISKISFDYDNSSRLFIQYFDPHSSSFDIPKLDLFDLRFISQPISGYLSREIPFTHTMFLLSVWNKNKKTPTKFIEFTKNQNYLYGTLPKELKKALVDAKIVSD